MNLIEQYELTHLTRTSISKREHNSSKTTTSAVSITIETAKTRDRLRKKVTFDTSSATIEASFSNKHRHLLLKHNKHRRLLLKYSCSSLKNLNRRQSHLRKILDEEIVVVYSNNIFPLLTFLISWESRLFIEAYYYWQRDRYFFFFIDMLLQYCWVAETIMIVTETMMFLS